MTTPQVARRAAEEISNRPYCPIEETESIIASAIADETEELQENIGQRDVLIELLDTKLRRLAEIADARWMERDRLRRYHKMQVERLTRERDEARRIIDGQQTTMGGLKKRLSLLEQERDALAARVAQLESEAAHDRAVLTVPEVYYGVVSEEVSLEIERLRKENAQLRSGVFPVVEEPPFQIDTTPSPQTQGE